MCFLNQNLLNLNFLLIWIRNTFLYLKHAPLPSKHIFNRPSFESFCRTTPNLRFDLARCQTGGAIVVYVNNVHNHRLGNENASNRRFGSLLDFTDGWAPQKLKLFIEPISKKARLMNQLIIKAIH